MSIKCITLALTSCELCLHSNFSGNPLSHRIPPNVRDIVYCTGVSLMDEDVWEFIWMKFHSSTAISEKKVLLEALTCSDNIFLLNRSVHLINNDEAMKFK